MARWNRGKTIEITPIFVVRAKVGLMNLRVWSNPAVHPSVDGREVVDL